MSALKIPTADVFAPLYKPARYKGAWGGRGSGKSHDRAGALIDDSLYEKGLLSVCIREVQKSLKDSAKRLLESKLAEFKLGEADGFKVYTDRIQTPGDGVIIFQGMQDHTAESIKSLEGFKRAWVEEAQTLSKNSLNLLRPTIRAPGSELWFTWNPRHRRDAVDKMFRDGPPPTDSVVVRANWNDNPWFPKELEQERLDMKANDPDQYDHTWDGDYAKIIEGAYYAEQLTEARKSGRIGHVAADPLMNKLAFWDIGGTSRNADACVIWIAQWIGTTIRFVDYYTAQGQDLATHVRWLKDNGHGHAICVLPHDGSKGNDIYDVTYQSALAAAGFETKVIKNQGRGAAMLRVYAARRLFGSMFFDEEKCKDGLLYLGQYKSKKSKADVDLGPDHDDASHTADAFGLCAVAYELPERSNPFEDEDDASRGRNGHTGY